MSRVRNCTSPSTLKRRWCLPIKIFVFSVALFKNFLSSETALRGTINRLSSLPSPSISFTISASLCPSVPTTVRSLLFGCIWKRRPFNVYLVSLSPAEYIVFSIISSSALESMIISSSSSIAGHAGNSFRSEKETVQRISGIAFSCRVYRLFYHFQQCPGIYDYLFFVFHSRPCRKFIQI